LHPSLLTVPSLDERVGTPQASVAVAVPNAPFISPAEGLHPSCVPVPPVVITGGVRSAVHVTVRDAVDILPQKSRAVNVLVCERPHPLLPTLPSLCVTVGTPHASVAVAVPSEVLISPADGLHPSVSEPPPLVITGGVKSTIHVAVREAEDVLPQASIALNVLVCERLQPSLVTEPSLTLIVGLPHASFVDAVPRHALISPADGLHPSEHDPPPVTRLGGVLSALHVTVRAAVEVLPQASLAVHVLV